MTQRILLFLLILGSVFAGVLAQNDKSQTPSTPPSVGTAQKDAAPAKPQPTVPTESYIERARRTGPVLELTLNDAIKMALTNNLEIAIEDFNEDINDKRYIGIKGFYDPVMTVEGGYRHITSPTGSVLTAGAGQTTFQSKSSYWNTSVAQNLPWGASYNVVWNSSRQLTNSLFSTINPQYNSNFTLNFTQPLLRGYGRTQTKHMLKLTNLDSKTSESQFEQKVADIVRQVHDQYWELVYALRNEDIKRQSVVLAGVQYNDNRKRVEIGTLAPIEITIARAEVATREQDMIASEEGINNAENNLKRLLAPDPRADVWNITLIPNDEPKFIDYKVDLDQAIKEAIKNRPEIEQMKIQMDRTVVDQEFYRQEGKWKVNFVGSYFSTGLAGEAFKNTTVTDPTTGIPQVVRVPNPESPFFGSLGPLYSQVFGNDFHSYTAGVQVEIPLRNRQNDMQLAQLFLQQKQNVSRMKNVEQQIVVDVRNAAESIETNRKRVEAARVARELSQEQLDGETKRFQAGLTTNFVVLTYQRNLANAQLLEMRALIEYRKAITALQKATYTILSGNDLQTAKQGNGKNGSNPPPQEKKN